MEKFHFGGSVRVAPDRQDLGSWWRGSSRLTLQKPDTARPDLPFLSVLYIWALRLDTGSPTSPLLPDCKLG